MTSRVSKLVLAAVVAGSIPALASASGSDYDHDRDGRPVVVAPVHAPPPAWAPPAQHPAPPAWQAWRDRRGHEAGWRSRELASVHAELRALDAQRAEFHARNGWRPGQLRRFDRWYFERRAQLERRERELERVAWR